MALCPTWGDRVRYLDWLYCANNDGDNDWDVTFRFETLPVTVRLVLRDNSGSDSFVLGEVFEQCCYRADPEWAPGRVLDLGANAGFSTVFFSARWPEAVIASVEPMPDNLHSLARNREMNAVPGRIFEGAVTVEPGQVAMHCGSRDGLNSIMPDAKELTEDAIAVRGWTVPEIMEAMGWDGIDFLKIDIEGYESELLQRDNAWLSRVKRLCLEVHGGFGRAELEQLGHAFGFSVQVLDSGIWLFERQDG